MSRQLNVALFSNHFVVQQGVGIARYAHQLHQALHSIQSDIKLTAVSSWKPHKVHNLPHLQERLDLRLLPWGKRLTGLSWVFFKRPFLENGLDTHVDIVHPLSVFYPVPTRKPLVVTVHDIMPITHPEFFPKVTTALYCHFMKIGLNYIVDHAAAIICVSQATADELELFAKQDLGSRVHVIREGVNPLFLGKPDMSCLREIASFQAVKAPFVLTVGGLTLRKNIGRVIEAMERLKDVIPHHLVLVGLAWWRTDKILRQCRESKISDRIHYLGYVSDNQLHALYSIAKAFVYVSLFEGFGLPVVEALASGCPVVTSNISSLPEVAGDAALLVDPYDVNAIAEGIHAACSDAGLAEGLVKRGRARARTFTWERCAEQVAGVYQSIA